MDKDKELYCRDRWSGLRFFGLWKNGGTSASQGERTRSSPFMVSKDFRKKFTIKLGPPFARVIATTETLKR